VRQIFARNFVSVQTPKTPTTALGTTGRKRRGGKNKKVKVKEWWWWSWRWVDKAIKKSNKCLALGRPFGHIRHGRKSGELRLFGGSWAEAYLRTKYAFDSWKSHSTTDGRNRWTDFRQIHAQDVFVLDFECQGQRSRSPGTKTRCALTALFNVIVFHLRIWWGLSICILA